MRNPKILALIVLAAVLVAGLGGAQRLLLGQQTDPPTPPARETPKTRPDFPSYPEMPTLPGGKQAPPMRPGRPGRVRLPKAASPVARTGTAETSPGTARNPDGVGRFQIAAWAAGSYAGYFVLDSQTGEVVRAERAPIATMQTGGSE